jgi:hypothetical protein
MTEALQYAILFAICGTAGLVVGGIWATIGTLVVVGAFAFGVLSLYARPFPSDGRAESEP